MPAPPWDAVLFDLDGTLANTVPLIVACFRYSMEIHRPGEEPDIPWLLSNVGRKWDETVAELEPDPTIAEAMKADFRVRQDQLHDEMVTPHAGALIQCERMVMHDVPIAIVTSKARPMTQRTMRVCALDPHFEHIITADDVDRGKPDPEPVLLALSRLGIGASRRVLFIGDSPHDIVAGQRAGVSTLGVSWGAATPEQVQAAEPDYFIRRFDDLEEVERGVG